MIYLGKARRGKLENLPMKQLYNTWFSLVAPVITDETLGFDAHQAIASWDNGTSNASAIGFKPLTFLSTSSTSDLLAKFYTNKQLNE